MRKKKLRKDSVGIDDLAATQALVAVGVGPRAPKSEEEQFLGECIRWLREWERIHKEDARPNGISVFLFQKNRRPGSIIPGATPLRAFRESYPDALVGRAFACTLLMESVFSGTLSEECKDAPDVPLWLASLRVRDVLAVVFIPKQHAAVVLPSDPSSSAIRVPLSPTGAFTFTLGQLDTVLENFYTHAVSTHNGHCPIWRDHNTRKLAPYPERTVHGSLFMFLLGLIEMHDQGTVRVEVQNPFGRNDIEIVCYSNGKYRVGILELKVLSPRKTEGANLLWAKDGIGQVLKYSDTYKAPGGGSSVDAKYVCCYDGRKKDKRLPAFFAAAKKKDVVARRYFMTTPGVSRKFASFNA